MRDEPTDNRPPVVLLHGLGRTRSSLWGCDRFLRRGGRRTLRLGYASRRHSIPELAAGVAREIEERLPGAARIDFVTHSLGGILLRVMARGPLAGRVGRAVMLGPPNQGSEVVDRLGDTWFYRASTGPAGRELGTAEGSLVRELGRVDFEAGVIAGTRSLNPILARLIPGPHDGKVSVERAKVEGMADFLVVDRSHTFMMNAPDVLRQIAHFLDHGRFAQPGAPAPDADAQVGAEHHHSPP